MAKNNFSYKYVNVAKILAKNWICMIFYQVCMKCRAECCSQFVEEGELYRPGLNCTELQLHCTTVHKPVSPFYCTESDWHYISRVSPPHATPASCHCGAGLMHHQRGEYTREGRVATPSICNSWPVDFLPIIILFERQQSYQISWKESSQLTMKN